MGSFSAAHKAGCGDAQPWGGGGDTKNRSSKSSLKFEEASESTGYMRSFLKKFKKKNTILGDKIPYVYKVLKELKTLQKRKKKKDTWLCLQI